ncbi:MAG: hypothetical protein R3F34_00325 [Planctomycetota bacterium]
MKRTSTSSSAAKWTKASISSSFTPPSSTTLSFRFGMPASRAARRPRSTSSSLPPPVSSAKRAGSRLSQLTFTVRSPARARSCARRSSNRPFVVSATSVMPSMRAMRSTISGRSRRSVGSPPVSRTLRKPSRSAATRRMRSTSAGCITFAGSSCSVQ